MAETFASTSVDEHGQMFGFFRDQPPGVIGHADLEGIPARTPPPETALGPLPGPGSPRLASPSRYGFYGFPFRFGYSGFKF